MDENKTAEQLEETRDPDEASRSRFGLLEFLLLVAAHMLLYQSFPSTWANLERFVDVVIGAVDFTRWEGTTWFSVNFSLVAVLVLVRYAPDWNVAWSAIQDRWRKKTERFHRDTEEAEKQKVLHEQREALGRLQEGRGRRIY